MTITIDTDTILNLIDPVVLTATYIGGAYGVAIPVIRNLIRNHPKYGYSDFPHISKEVDAVMSYAAAPIWMPLYLLYKFLSFGIKEKQ